MILRWQQLFVDFRLRSILLDWVKHICPKIFSKLTIWSLVLSDDKDRLVIRKQEINFWKIIKDFFGIWYNTISSSPLTAYPSMICSILLYLLFYFTILIWTALTQSTFSYICLNIQPMNLLCPCCWNLYGSSMLKLMQKRLQSFDWICIET